ncbi:hypothetical protein C8Q76DRAFT_784084 [Earliella scabrosa]|nr:hypothetical protein C8Q76DRAFT_784084 [Earliella scabrosa]
MADQTVVDRSVRDTWEIDAKQVSFRSGEEWSRFLERTVMEVCDALGVNHAASQPRCELYKLLLYETGSHFLPHVDTEKQDGMFATIVIILPCEFTGGVVRVSHGGLSSTYDCSPTSLMRTSVLAWYTDVMHAVEPITSGHRLALAFNLVHTTQRLRPALGAQTKLVNEMRRILLAWKCKGRGGKGCPEKLVCMLAHKYSQANLRGSALKGADAHRVALLDVLARELGFHVGLANVVCHEHGYADDDGQYRGGGGGWYSDDDSDEFDEGPVGMAEVEETAVSVENLVDLDGKMIRADVEFEAETETIPEDLVQQVLDGPVDKQEYEGYMGNGAGSLDRWYRRTVLVVWPSWSHFDIIHGEEGFAYACRKIAQFTSGKPTSEELELVDIALSRATQYECNEVVNSVCRAASSWGDLDIWIRAVKACDADRDIKTLREENILRAVEAFGFYSVETTIDHALEWDKGNAIPLKFLDNFEEWSKSQDELIVAQTTDWISQWRRKILESLRPVRKGEAEYLIELSLRTSDVEYLEHTMVPQLTRGAGPLFLFDCAEHVHKLARLSAEDQSRLAHHLIDAAISKSDVYAPDQDALAAAQAQSPKPATPSAVNAAASLIHAVSCFTTCLDTGHEDLLPGFIAKLTAFAGVPSAIAQQRAKDVLLGLIRALAAKVEARGPERPIPDLNKLCDTASTLYLEWITASPGTFNRIHIAGLFEAAIYGGESEKVLTHIVPKLEELRLPSAAIRVLAEELDAHHQPLIASTSQEELNTVIARLVKVYASVVDLSSIPVITTTQFWKPQPPPRLPTLDTRLILDALELCIRLNVPDACSSIVSRVLSHKPSQREQCRDLLLSLIPALKSLLAKYRYAFTAEPYAPLFRSMMVFWVDRILGVQPAPEASAAELKRMQNWTCVCAYCIQVRAFLQNEAAQTRSWERVGARIRGHLEKELGKYCWNSASWEKITTTPQGIKVTKDKVLYEPIRWREAQRDGVVFYGSISANYAEMQTILHGDHARVALVLGIERTAPAGQMPPPPEWYVAITGHRPPPPLAFELRAHDINDLHAQLEELFTKSIDPDTPFVSFRSYSEAPNPILHIEGLGTIGLPLTERDAKTIKDHVDPTGSDLVKHAWEIEVDKVAMKHKSWPGFLDSIIRDACGVLGVEADAGYPRSRLRSLSLIGTDGRIQPDHERETSQPKGMFATLMIILPSEHTGGAVHVSHGIFTHQYDCSSEDLSNTTVLAWTETKSMQRLRTILQTWNEGRSSEPSEKTETPKKILYVLDSHYEQTTTLGRSVLEDRDAHILELVEHVANPLGFRLGLATWTCEVTCDTAELDDASDYEYERMMSLGGPEVERQFAVVDLVDMQGDLILKKVKYDYEREMIPLLFDDDFGDDHGEDCGVYKRTVIMLWPHWAYGHLIHGDPNSGFAYALAIISKSQSSASTSEEKEMVEVVLTRAVSLSGTTKAKALTVLCTAAIRWLDATLWARAVEDLHDDEKHVPTLTHAHIVDALSAFGFSSLQTCIEGALERCSSNMAVFDIVEKLAKWEAETSGANPSNIPTGWSADQRVKRFRSLKRPSQTEFSQLISSAVEQGDVEFLETMLLPQITKLLNSASLLHFAVSLYGADCIPADDRPRLARIVLASGLVKVNFYAAAVPVAKSSRSRRKPKPVSVPSQAQQQQQRAKLWLTTCSEIGADNLASTIVDKLLHPPGEQTNTVSGARAREVLLPLISSFHTTIRERYLDQLQRLCVATTKAYVDDAVANPQIVGPEGITQLIHAALFGLQHGDLIEQFIPRLEARSLSSTKALSALIAKLTDQRASFVSNLQCKLDSTLARLVKRLSAAVSQEVRRWKPDRLQVDASRSTLDTVELCLKVGVPESCPPLLDAFLHASAWCVQEYQVPLVSDLRSVLQKYGQSSSLPHFAPTFRSIILAWEKQTLGQPPVNVDSISAEIGRALSPWTCDCRECGEVRAFIASVGPETKKTWENVGGPGVKHVQGFAEDFAAKYARVTSVRKTFPTVVDLVVNRTKRTVESLQWMYYQAKCVSLLESVSSDSAELQAILGPDYARIKSKLDNTFSPADFQAIGTRSEAPTSMSSAQAGRGVRDKIATFDPPSIVQRPAKRRKTAYSEEDVIDLT